MSKGYIQQADLDLMLNIRPEMWNVLYNKSIFIAGGTGFLGIWILTALKEAQTRNDQAISLTVLSRNPEAFLLKNPEFRDQGWLQFVQGDVETFPFPDQKFDFVIHAATEASVKLNLEQPIKMLDNNVLGTRRMLDFAVHCQAARFLYTSSGAVYGEQPGDLTHIPEDYQGAPDVLKANAAYGEGKRVGELLCNLYARKHDFSVTIARCFAFAGPYLPIDSHFAIGNFVRDGIRQSDISIAGDGRPRRSYLYAADLVVWLLVILLYGKSGEAYNVGSDEDLSIEELANQVSGSFRPSPKVKILGKRTSDRIPKYVPLVDKARKELGLVVYTPLTEVINRMISFYN